ncbi:MAG TPA: ATP-binding cassette domain-containing protein [Porticoccaceae bacterium]|nr:ATP-binding cassette domain-containing protein [Porticoccaceae bacterium]
MNTESREPVLRCQGVDKSYRQGSQLVKVLGDVNCAIAAGELVAIVGSSGSGKSTLLNLMGGLDDPDRGEIHVNGQLLQPLSESRRARWRNAHLGFVYQFHHLLGEFTALENVAIPNLIGGKGHGEANAIARVLLERVGLGERIGHRPAALSGGERQRVAIARALATSPSCVLMDEPTGNLDPTTAATVLNLLLELNRDLGISFVIVTHDMSIAARMDRILRLDGGRLEAAVA